MRALHELVFDDWLDGNALRGACPAPWSLALNAVDTFTVFVVADQVEGTDPTLTLIALESPDFINIVVTKTLFSVAPLFTSQQTVLRGTYTPSDAEYAGSHLISFFMALGGGSPRAHIRIWVTGRED